MKKLLIGLAIGLALGVPATALAAYVELPRTKNIYNVSDAETHGATVSTFDNAGNRCYVVVGNVYKNPAQGISCVRMSK